MHSALLSRFAPRCGELEEARGAICAASVGASSRQMVQNDGEIVQSLYFLCHGSLPFSVRFGGMLGPVFELGNFLKAYLGGGTFQGRRLFEPSSIAEMFIP